MKTLAALILLSLTAFAQSLNVTYDGKTTAVDVNKMQHEAVKYTNPHDKSDHTYSCVSITPV